METQKLLFSKIKKRIASKGEWAREIADLLYVSREAVYRRERGEVMLDLHELEKLCKHYKISLDSLIESQNERISFTYNNLVVNQSTTYKSYIQGLRDLLKQVEEAKDKEILFCADDIPLFHFMAYPELTYFKLYTWSQSLRNIEPDMLYEDFEQELKGLELQKLFSDISKSYRMIPSREIWTKETILPIITLIEYFNTIGCFGNPESKYRLCKQLLDLVSRLERWTMLEEKRKGVDFGFYLSPIGTGISHMLCMFDSKKIASIKLYTINSISTDDKQYIADHLDWIKAIMSKSSCLSNSSENLRIQFFGNLRKQVQDLKKRLM